MHVFFEKKGITRHNYVGMNLVYLGFRSIHRQKINDKKKAVDGGLMHVSAIPIEPQIPFSALSAFIFRGKRLNHQLCRNLNMDPRASWKYGLNYCKDRTAGAAHL